MIFTYRQYHKTKYRSINRRVFFFLSVFIELENTSMKGSLLPGLVYYGKRPNGHRTIVLYQAMGEVGLPSLKDNI